MLLISEHSFLNEIIYILWDILEVVIIIPSVKEFPVLWNPAIY